METIQVSLNGKTKIFTSRLEAIQFIATTKNGQFSKAQKTTLNAINDGRKILLRM